MHFYGEKPQPAFQHITTNTRQLTEGVTPHGRALVEGYCQGQGACDDKTSLSKFSKWPQWPNLKMPQKKIKSIHKYIQTEKKCSPLTSEYTFKGTYSLSPETCPESHRARGKSSLSPIKSLAAGLTSFASVSYFSLPLLTET